MADGRNVQLQRHTLREQHFLGGCHIYPVLKRQKTVRSELTVHSSPLLPDNDLRDATTTQREIQYLLCYLKCRKRQTAVIPVARTFASGKWCVWTTRNVVTGSEPSLQQTRLVWFLKHFKTPQHGYQRHPGEPGDAWQLQRLKGGGDIWSFRMFLTSEQYEKQGRIN